MLRLLLLIAALLSACASTPATRFHSLLSTSEERTSEEPSAPQASGWAFDLGPVSVPSAVDQMQWVVRMPDDSLRVLEQEQWVSPLREELRAAIAQRLVQRFGAADVRSVPGAASAWRLRVDVLRFESIAGKEVWLDAVWSASSTRGNSLTCKSMLREAAAGDATALAAAHRRAVNRLADQIGAQISGLTRNSAASC